MNIDLKFYNKTHYVCMINKIEIQSKTAGRYIQNEIKTMSRSSLSRQGIFSRFFQVDPILYTFDTTCLKHAN